MHCLNVDAQINFEILQSRHLRWWNIPIKVNQTQVSDWMNMKMACFILNTGLVGSLGL